MSISALPRPVASYIAAANVHDAEAVAACFAEDAVVRDEGQRREGLAAIRAWAEEASAKYRPTLDVIGAATADGQTVVTGRVSGSFPGSPVTLRFAFALRGDRIARLEIS